MKLVFSDGRWRLFLSDYTSEEYDAVLQTINKP